MVKRPSENGQIRKEDLEQECERDGPAMGRFDTASKEQMRNRRIRRVDRKWKPENTIQPPSAAAKAPLVSRAPANPFANTKLQTPKTHTFAPTGAPMFGSSFVSDTGSTTATKPMTTNSYKNTEINLNEAEKLNLTITRLGQSEWNIRQKADWSCFLKNYVTKIEALQKGCNFETTKDNEEQSGATDGANKSGNAGAETPLVLGTTGPTAAPPSPKISRPSSSLAFGGGSSSGTPVAAAPPAQFSGFSFAAGSAAGTDPAPPAALANPAGSGAGDETPKEEKTEVIAVKNEEEEELHLCRAKYRKYFKKEGTWKDFSAGQLRLCRHTVRKSCYITLRNEYGSVKLNLAISKGMTFKKILQKSIGSVQFAAVQDEAVGIEIFLLVVKPSNLDKLHETLEKMAE